MQQRNSSSSPSPLRVTLIYAAFGTLWIFFSDLLAARIFPPSLFGAVSIIKGCLFIAATSAVLALLLRRHQARLEQQHRRLQEIIDNLPSYLYAFDRTGKAVLINRAMGKLCGTPSDEAVGKDRATLGVSPEAVAEHRANDLRVFANGEPLVTEERNPQADGLHTYLTVKFPLLDRDGRIEAVCGISTDITAQKRIEEELRESELRLQQLGDSLPDSYVYQYVHELDDSTHFTYLSAGVERVHGVVRAEALRSVGTLHLQVDPAQRAYLIDREAESRRNLSDLQLRLRFLRGDGEWRWLQVLSRPRRKGDGRTIWDGVATDITERVVVEQALQALAREWQHTFDAIPDAIALLDRDFRILHWNRAFAELAGVKTQTMLGRHCWELMHHGTEPSEFCPYARMQASRRSERSEHRHGERWLEVRVDPILNDDGAMSGAVHIIADITERKQAEQLLFDNEQSLRQLFSEMQSGFALHEILCDKQGTPFDYRFLMVNPAFARQFGLSATEIVGKTAREVFPQTEPSLIERYGKVALSGESTQFEFFSRELGRHFGVRAYCPEPRKFAILCSDITERFRAEQELKSLLAELEQRNIELEQFSYSVSHDLKTPLVTISGFAGQLRADLEPGVNGKVGVDLDFIEGAARQMGLLLDNLLQLARSGRIIGELGPVDLAATIHQALELSRGVLGESTVSLDIAADLPPIEGDAVRLREVFQNLLENAAKFSRRGNPLQVEITVKATGNGQLLCTIRDNGIGIPPPYLERIFGLFERLDQNRGGTGVGLALARRIVDKHGGRIWAESAGEGKGTTFLIALPVAGSRR